ncbi:hypothetical protein [Photorhabdus luminescens]|nr:hypothetical protein [Photorhabdus luminescens]MCW7760368.1 hypothetical protein [Photorhabdus luminescens subsp. venezuelensis]
MTILTADHSPDVLLKITGIQKFLMWKRLCTAEAKPGKMIDDFS